jgi:hypothetical protein
LGAGGGLCDGGSDANEGLFICTDSDGARWDCRQTIVIPGFLVLINRYKLHAAARRVPGFIRSVARVHGTLVIEGNSRPLSMAFPAIVPAAPMSGEIGNCHDSSQYGYVRKFF